MELSVIFKHKNWDTYKTWEAPKSLIASCAIGTEPCATFSYLSSFSIKYQPVPEEFYRKPSSLSPAWSGTASTEVSEYRDSIQNTDRL